MTNKKEDVISKIQAKAIEKWKYRINQIVSPIARDLISLSLEQERTEVLNEMEKIKKIEKKRCGEANAVTCWVMLRNWLETGKYFPEELKSEARK